MACEWVAPGLTAAVGVAGILGTWFTGSKRLSHERLLAEDARKQQRLEHAYIELLDMAERVGQWVERVYPVFGTTPPEPIPASPAEQAHTGALVNAFGSDRVLERMETWRAVVRKIITTVELVGWEEADPATRQREGEPTARATLHELRPQECTAREALANQVAAELGHRTDPRK
jgi:hypothetical protein